MSGTTKTIQVAVYLTQCDSNGRKKDAIQTEDRKHL